MASTAIEAHRHGAEVVRGHAECKKKILQLLEEHGLPLGVFPFDIEELGINRADGFVWVLQKEKAVHHFRKLGRLVSYAAEVTAFLEKGKLRKLTGVKTRELLLWFGVVELYIDPSDPGKIVFMTSTGLSDDADVDALALGE